jgi:hypothetical protein
MIKYFPNFTFEITSGTGLLLILQLLPLILLLLLLPWNGVEGRSDTEYCGNAPSKNIILAPDVDNDM